MTSFGRTLAVAATAAILALGACSPMYRNHGYVPSDADLAAIEIGATRDEIAPLVGRPSSIGLLADSGWYYVRSRYREGGIRGAHEIDREVVAISFDDSGRVTNVERFGLREGRVVPLSRRVTDSNVQGISLLRQLFGNLGRFSADQFFDEE